VKLSSGFPANPTVAFNRSQSLISGSPALEVPNLKPGADNNPQTGSRNTERFWDPASFELAPVGFFGNLGRNTMIGPGSATVDFSVFKNIPRVLSEDSQLQFRFESFNLLNRANFDLPNRSVFRTASGVPDPAFGRITSARESRELQFGLKLTW